MTGSILLAVVVLLLAWEVYTLKSSTDAHETITSVVRKAVAKHPILLFLAGVLAGHLFWP